MTVVGIDLGKTSARARLVGEITVETRADGCPGLAERGAADLVVARVSGLVRELADAAGAGSVDRLVLGVPGAESAPEVAHEVAVALAVSGPVHVVGDSVTAHAGALGGRRGAVLSAGTGAVAVVLDRADEIHQLDGWGQWLGDDGSGSWIGRAGLRAALLHAEGRGGSSALRAAAERLFGTARQIPGAVARDGNPGGQLASFAPEVLAAARAGDEVAGTILRDAGAALGRTLASAARVGDVDDVAVVGGLASVPELVEPLRDELDGLVWEDEPGSSLDGAVLLALEPHRPHLRRAQKGAPA